MIWIPKIILTMIGVKEDIKILIESDEIIFLILYLICGFEVVIMLVWS